MELHEKEHGKLAKDIAFKIDKKLLSIGPKANCETLDKSGNKLAHKLMADLKKANKKYDTRTNHGETQKAWLYMHSKAKKQLAFTHLSLILKKD
ncbi:DUF922 domain-containing protein [Colwellia sp. UCD-KL20]|uniref:DUF922 domain-containing protein n=1 Tax=Colwellia sp. UCD-KL20 TaxID=1917165 RepID=UPI0009708607|nr:DUF922 domain-containing protein [Colwellia sp. UCD-KL20]